MSVRWIAEPVEFQDLRPGVPFYMANPLAYSPPNNVMPHYTCENLEPTTIVWTLYEGWRHANPWLKKGIFEKTTDDSQLGNLINNLPSDFF